MKNPDLFDEAKALACYGNPAILEQVLGEFLGQTDSMLVQLRQAVEKGNRDEIRKAVHWFRGGMSYLFSPATERICQTLDAQSTPDPVMPMEDTLNALQDVLQRLRDHFQLHAPRDGN